jgi:hypothetical protein
MSQKVATDYGKVSEQALKISPTPHCKVPEEVQLTIPVVGLGKGSKSGTTMTPYFSIGSYQRRWCLFGGHTKDRLLPTARRGPKQVVQPVQRGPKKIPNGREGGIRGQGRKETQYPNVSTKVHDTPCR